MRFQMALLIGLCATTVAMADKNLVEAISVSETVYVESPTDTDKDGIKDKIYVSIERPLLAQKLSSIYQISPYALGGTEVPMHNVDMEFLPQGGMKRFFRGMTKSSHGSFIDLNFEAPKYAQVSAHSVGTGKSTGCPTVGDMDETLAAKAVIDWLNGRARAFYEDGREAKADWANGNVGMTGVSYNGTLPIMVASTGVEGLKAIVPIAAISNWYDYYRSNGLVVNPGGYIGEDADILGYYVARKGSCQTELTRITKTQGRESGDFTPFWQKRDYLPNVKNIKAATFIIHGQSDWNVKQKQAIQLWAALEDIAPRRMFLHRGGHGSTSSHSVPKKIQMWFDHFLEGEENGITSGPQVEVELPDGSLMVQEEWPLEGVKVQRLYFAPESSLSEVPSKKKDLIITDAGKTKKLEALIENPGQLNEGRLAFITSPLDRATVLSGSAKVNLNLSVLNRKAANITVAIVEYDKSNRGKIITRGWADPQNHSDIKFGETLVPGKNYQLNFNLEPKQYRVAAGSRIGVLLTSTDYDYTLRPSPGTQIQFNLGKTSFVELELAQK